MTRQPLMVWRMADPKPGCLHPAPARSVGSTWLSISPDHLAAMPPCTLEPGQMQMQTRPEQTKADTAAWEQTLLGSLFALWTTTTPTATRNAERGMRSLLCRSPSRLGWPIHSSAHSAQRSPSLVQPNTARSDVDADGCPPATGGHRQPPEHVMGISACQQSSQQRSTEQSKREQTLRRRGGSIGGAVVVLAGGASRARDVRRAARVRTCAQGSRSLGPVSSSWLK